jgi:hypothetical protein
MTCEDADWAFGFVRASGDSRLEVLTARFRALREAKSQWRAQAQTPRGDWFDLLGLRAFNAAAPLREWFGALPVLTSVSPQAQLRRPGPASVVSCHSSDAFLCFDLRPDRQALEQQDSNRRPVPASCGLCPRAKRSCVQVSVGSN